jgi:hypothetical protein
MGKSGKTHFDVHDFAGAFTDTTSCSDLPDGYDEGCMFVLFPGVFTRLSKYRGAKFSGLNIHGGTPPMGDTSINWPTRCVSVFYPQGLAGSGYAKFPLAAGPLPTSEPYYTTPEMRFPE